MPIGYWDSTANGGTGCYIDTMSSTCTTLTFNGDGDWNGYTYVGGDLAEGYYGIISNSVYTSTYFIGGVATTLDVCGTGYWEANYYVDGVQTESAYSNCDLRWYYFGQAMDGLSVDGSGYQFDFGYFIGGQLTSLDNNGSGYWNNQAYYQGVLQGTGWNGYYYYINHEQTTLDSTGSGTWNGITYSYGTAQVYATIFEGVIDADWNTLANWTGGDLNDPLPAIYLPTGNDPLYIRGDLLNNSSPLTANASTATVLNNASVGINLTINSGYGTITFYNTAKLRDGVTITGNAVFRDMSRVTSGGATITGNVEFWDESLAEYDSMTSTVLYSPSGALFRHQSSLQTYLSGNAEFRDDATMSGYGQVSGTATFKGNSGNGINCGTLVRQHGGGINGSNILGFA